MKIRKDVKFCFFCQVFSINGLSTTFPKISSHTLIFKCMHFTKKMQIYVTPIAIIMFILAFRKYIKIVSILGDNKSFSHHNQLLNWSLNSVSSKTELTVPTLNHWKLLITYYLKNDILRMFLRNQQRNYVNNN